MSNYHVISDADGATTASAVCNPRIAIFVSTHKPVHRFESSIMQLVQVGAAQAKVRFADTLHDDEGENISERNPAYCELTTQYWAWKQNLDVDYVGFCHYRRYFDFNPEHHTENSYGEVIDGYIDEASAVAYHLDDASIVRAVRGYDVVTTGVNDIRRFMGPRATMRTHYAKAPALFERDLDHMMDILVAHHPEYAPDVRTFLEGHEACFCNMFIMRKDIFDAYCAWLFPLLDEFMATSDMSRYSKEALRTPGHLAERLLNIYLIHQRRQGMAWRHKEMQCVHFEHPERHADLAPLPTDDARPVVPVAFAADDAYVPMVTTTIHSMLTHASDDVRFDIVVLHRDITPEHQATMKAFLEQPGTVYLRFVDVSDIIGRYRLTTNNPHISVETYYRFLVQELLPFYDKVLYLDSDLIVLDDVAKLYALDMGECQVAAARDIDFAGNLNMKDGKRRRYAQDVLGMTEPFDYFQAGVLVLNTRAMRAAHSIEEWLTIAGDERYIYNDQDVLNAQCEGSVVFIDPSWNVMTDCAGRIKLVFAQAPADFFDAYQQARACERIVHYAGFEKPWNTPDCDRAELYWRYARETPFYEALLARLGGAKPRKRTSTAHARVLSAESGLRRVLDPLVPVGSARREVAKSLVRTITRKS